MTNSHCSKTTFVFLIFNILLALASHSLAVRNNPKDQNDKKKPDCLIVDPDGSALIPGLGRILVPIPGTASYDPPLGDSSPLPEDDGTFSPPADDGGFSPLPGGDDNTTPGDASPTIESVKQSIP